MGYKIKMKDYYNYYLTGCSDCLSKKEFSELIYKFNKEIANLVLEGNIVELPQKLGYLMVAGKKQKVVVVNDGKRKRIYGLAINRVKSRQKGKLIFYTNEHTGGIRYRFKWDKRLKPILFKNLYKFRAVWHNRIALAKKIFEGKTYIIERDAKVDNPEASYIKAKKRNKRKLYKSGRFN